MAQQDWFSTLKTAFKNNLLVHTVVVGIILTCLEKLVGMEFACPCEPKWNALFVIAYYIVPAVLTLLLMIYIQHADDDSIKKSEDESKRDERKREKLFSIFVPAILWLILLLMDGQYFACAMTSWSGRFVSVVEGDLHKWCEPTNHTNQASSEYLMMKTQLWFTLSQGIGIVLIILLTVAFGLCWWCKKEEQGGNYSFDRESNQNAEASL